MGWAPFLRLLLSGKLDKEAPIQRHGGVGTKAGCLGVGVLRDLRLSNARLTCGQWDPKPPSSCTVGYSHCGQCVQPPSLQVIFLLLSDSLVSFLLKKIF